MTLADRVHELNHRMRWKHVLLALFFLGLGVGVANGLRNYEGWRGDPQRSADERLREAYVAREVLRTELRRLDVDRDNLRLGRLLAKGRGELVAEQLKGLNFKASPTVRIRFNDDQPLLFSSTGGSALRFTIRHSGDR